MPVTFGIRLSGHPPARGMPEVAFGTGSLGHGLSLASGVALGSKLRKAPRRVFCLTSDGEWNEGSNWEALIFIRQHRLDNLTLIVDMNGLQGFGATRDIADLEPLADKFRAFGLRTVEINGHDSDSIRSALERPTMGPLAVLARTVKGSGVSFMENRFEWHYLPMTENQYRQAVRELKEKCATLSVVRS